MNIDFDNPIYIISLLLLISFGSYFYTRHRKLKRIKLLRNIGYQVSDKVSSIQRAGLIKLAPEIMSSEKLPFGMVKAGPKDPEVWWLAKNQNNDIKLSLFKIYKMRVEGRRAGEVEYLVAAISFKNSNLDEKQFKEISLRIQKSDEHYLTNNGAYFVYQDSFISNDDLVKLTNKIMSFKPI